MVGPILFILVIFLAFRAYSGLLIMSEIVTEAAVPSEEVIARANALKDEGNVFLAQHKYAHAAEKYSAALELHQTAIFYSNRAQALIKLESYGSAIADANEALKYVISFCSPFQCLLLIYRH